MALKNAIKSRLEGRMHIVTPIVALIVVTALVVVAVALGIGGGGGILAHVDPQSCGVVQQPFLDGDGSPRLLVQHFGVDAGDSLDVPLILDGVPNGLSGFIGDVAVEPLGVVVIGDIGFPQFGIERLMRNTGSTARFAVVDIRQIHEQGTDAAVVATAMLDAVGQGVASITVSVIQMDDDSGAAIEPLIVAGSVIVCAPPPD
jgi:hypothetical protein